MARANDLPDKVLPLHCAPFRCGMLHFAPACCLKLVQLDQWMENIRNRNGRC